MKIISHITRGAAALAVALLTFATVAQADCTTNTPLSVWGQNGSNGLVASSGTPNSYDAGSVVGQITNNLTDLNGTANIHGSADCSDDLAALHSDLSRELRDAQNETLSIAAAISNPAYLRPGEKFSLSFGTGFADDAFALGGTGMIDLGSNVAGYAGGAFSTDNTDVWAGKAGLRVGW